MAIYEVDLIKPGRTSSQFSQGVEVTEEELREAVDSLEGIPVEEGSFPASTVGEVIDAKYDDGVKCTVEIDDEYVIEKLDVGLGQIAPVFVYNHSNARKPSTFFIGLRAVPKADPLVGEVERIDDEQWLFGWEQ